MGTTNLNESRKRSWKKAVGEICLLPLCGFLALIGASAARSCWLYLELQGVVGLGTTPEHAALEGFRTLAFASLAVAIALVIGQALVRMQVWSPPRKGALPKILALTVPAFLSGIVLFSGIAWFGVPLFATSLYEPSFEERAILWSPVLFLPLWNWRLWWPWLGKNREDRAPSE